LETSESRLARSLRLSQSSKKSFNLKKYMMRSITIIYFLACFLFYKANLNAQNSTDDKTQPQKNTSFKSGENWYDENGNIINAHGGGILFYNGTYYWYGEIKKAKRQECLMQTGKITG